MRESAQTGVPPTVREICAATGIRSTSTEHMNLKALEEGGYISRQAGRNRSIQLEGSAPAEQVPILGRVTAGAPILAVEEIQATCRSRRAAAPGASVSRCACRAKVCATPAF